MVQFDWSLQIQAAVFKTWQATGGKGVKIAVLDTGVDLAHPALKHLNITGHKLNAAAPGFNPSKPQLHGNGIVADAHRKRGHGTQCVSVISSKAAGSDALLGIAPKAEVFIIKINTVDNKFFLVKDFLRGLEAAANIGVDLVVASIAYLPGDLALERITPAEVDRVFGLLKQSGATLLAALPNKDQSQSWVGIAANSFPGQRPETVNIGAVSQAMLDARKEEIDAEPDVHFLVSNAAGNYCKINGEYIQEPISSSYATYAVAGIAALYLAALKKRTKTEAPDLENGDFSKGFGQRFVKLSEAPDILDSTVPIFFKKTNADV
jgi:subtilisin family serine protease